MKFKGYLYFCTVFFLISDIAVACNIPAGKYGHWVGCSSSDCPSGCYCPGKTENTESVNHNNIKNYCAGTINYSALSGGDKKTVDRYLKKCPEDFPDSVTGAKSINECHTTSVDGHMVRYGEKFSCAKGYYLPAGHTKCASCTNSTSSTKGTSAVSTDSTKDTSIASTEAYARRVTQGISFVQPNNFYNSDVVQTVMNTVQEDMAQTAMNMVQEDMKNISEKSACPGLSNVEYSKTKNQGIQDCPSGQKPNSDKTACIPESCPFGQAFNASKTKCVAATEDCDEGQYLPKNKLECSKCPDGWACKESKTYTFSSSKDQGKTEQCTGNKVANSKRSACETCPNDQEPNASHTQCVKKAQSESETTYCDPGYYLQKQSSSCKSCSSLGEKYYCPGGDLTVADNGLATCDDGYIANSDHTACVEKDKEYIYVPNGKYLKSTETTPSDCPDISTKYCPGGEYEKSAATQGMYDCPLNSRQNSTKDGCNITFTMEQLQYGYSKDSNPAGCWIYENPDDYIDCVLGL